MWPVGTAGGPDGPLPPMQVDRRSRIQLLVSSRSMPRGCLWTSAEDRLVREAAAQNRQHGIAGGGRYENRLRAVAERIGRSYSAVRSRAIHLRAKSYGYR